MIQRWPFRVNLWIYCLLLAACTGSEPEKKAFVKEKEDIMMREVAHRVLLYTGDSISPVPPVSRISDYRFRISFSASFSFQPDSLVQVIRRTITGRGMPADYVVNVLEGESRKVVFGYAISGSAQQDIIPCSGREQPRKQYIIDIHFKEPEQQPVSLLIPALLIAAALSGLIIIIKKRRKNRSGRTSQEGVDHHENNADIVLGRFLFNPDQLSLTLNGERQVLTVKEAKLLRILAGSINQVVDRSRLQKEVWEDEGVIVGRSLDVFISRLRKKIEADPGVKITGVHGKGYKLEINDSA